MERARLCLAHRIRNFFEKKFLMNLQKTFHARDFRLGRNKIFFLPKAIAFGNQFSLEIVKNHSFLKEWFLTGVPRQSLNVPFIKKEAQPLKGETPMKYTKTLCALLA